jgi:hypothetical protein
MRETLEGKGVSQRVCHLETVRVKTVQHLQLTDAASDRIEGSPGEGEDDECLASDYTSYSNVSSTYWMTLRRDGE